MRIAIMQPYFFPYVGYWQLIAAADRFVILDDVNFINRGWINRNQVVVNNSAAWLTLPLNKASQNKLIHDIDILEDDGWKMRMKRTLSHSYSKAPSFSDVSEVIEELLQNAQGNLSSYLSEMIAMVSSRLEVATVITPTSRVFPKKNLKGQERILNICKSLGATRYINLPGGRALYDPVSFQSEGIQLEFLETPAGANLRTGLGIEKPLSILDTLMYNTKAEVKRAVSNFKISTENHED